MNHQSNSINPLIFEQTGLAHEAELGLNGECFNEQSALMLKDLLKLHYRSASLLPKNCSFIRS